MVKNLKTEDGGLGPYISWYSEGEVYLVNWWIIWVLILGFTLGIVLRSWGER